MGFAILNANCVEVRAELCITGAVYKKNNISLITDMGNLTIKGTDLKINRFSTEKGELDIEGLIVAFVYTHDTKNTTFFSKIFK